MTIETLITRIELLEERINQDGKDIDALVNQIKVLTKKYEEMENFMKGTSAIMTMLLKKVAPEFVKKVLNHTKFSDNELRLFNETDFGNF